VLQLFKLKQRHYINRKQTINMVSLFLQGKRFAAAVPFLSEEMAIDRANTAAAG
jgi:hypothetical protein